MTAGIVDASLTLERGCLGAAILDVTGKQAATLVVMLRDDDFVGSLHRQVFIAIKHLVARHDLPLEYVSLMAELQAKGVFDSFNNA